MAKLIGIDWDRTEVRAVVGKRQGSRLAIEQVVSVPRPAGAEPTADDFSNLAKLVTEALTKCNAGRADVVISLGRGQVEFRALQIPPCDADEVPDVARFQAGRFFSNFGEAWPLDFVPMPPTEGQVGASVLASTVNPAAVALLQTACENAGATLTKLSVRPMAAAQLLELAEEGLRSGTVMLIAPLADEADLTVCEDGTVVFVRSVRLPSATADIERSSALVAEVRRTLMAYETQRVGGRSVQQIVLWGNGDDQIVADMLTSQVKLPSQVIDPLSLIDGKSIPLDKAIGMAPVLGLLSHETLGLRQTVDFLHPRRRAPKKRPVKLIAGIAMAATVLFAGGAFWWASTNSSLDFEIAAEREASNSMADMVAASQVNQKKWQMVESFLAKDIPWINELQHLSKNAPPADEAVFLGVKFNVTSLGRGEIKTIVATKGNDVFPKLESGLRDAKHEVNGTLARDLDNQSTDYKARVDETILVPFSKIDGDGNIILNDSAPAPSPNNTPTPVSPAPAADSTVKPAVPAEPASTTTPTTAPSPANQTPEKNPEEEVVVEEAAPPTPDASEPPKDSTAAGEPVQSTNASDTTTSGSPTEKSSPENTTAEGSASSDPK